MHVKKIAHRDIKLENILMTRTTEPLEVKLTDFGFASVLDENHMFKDSLGSPNYMAPELIMKEPYDEKVDIWACGCVLYSMLCGMMAFDGDNKK
jgi:serine/threonine protein kinase